MAERNVQRRLAAILAADIAEYTRRMEADTDGTVAAWHAARADVIDPEDPTTWGKVGRNSACPCGSGKKYKHCHGAH